jgi:hypothetical protein
MKGACIGCGQSINFDPLIVPSVHVDGNKQPLCRHCVARMNMIRTARGEPRIEPLPGAWAPETPD